MLAEEQVIDVLVKEVHAKEEVVVEQPQCIKAATMEPFTHVGLLYW